MLSPYRMFPLGIPQLPPLFQPRGIQPCAHAIGVDRAAGAANSGGIIVSKHITENLFEQ